MQTPRNEIPAGGTGREGVDQPVSTGAAPPFKASPRRKLRRGKTKGNSSAASTGGGIAQDRAPVDPTHLINRELSWLEFNQRVLDEANDERHPLLERVKFLAIVSSNLDEYFMIRVSGIKEQIRAGIAEPTPDGKSPATQLHDIHGRVTRMLTDMSRCFWSVLHPKLAAASIHLLNMNELTARDRATMDGLFAREIYPVLTPLAFDPGHPFPYISNLSLNCAVVVMTPEGDERFARVKIPDVLPRLVPIPSDQSTPGVFRCVWLEDLIAANLPMLFPGMTVKESYAFRVTRNADIEIQEDEAEDLIHSIEESIRLRRFGSIVRVGVEQTMPARIREVLVENLEATPDDVYELTPPLGLSHLMALTSLPKPELKDPPYSPHAAVTLDDGEDFFSTIRRGDILLHHPYDSFTTVVQFIASAARDPNVLAIKQTLYRIGKESPLIPLLIEAAANSKQVAVLVELKARFDEENNIGWAKQLERAGVHVVYGLVGLKTHAKMALIVRREHDGLRRYVHLGTGNYNPVTARVYTDFGYMTCREEIAEDATEVFNFLTGYSKREQYAKLAVAPVTLRQRILQLMDREIHHAQGGGEGRMILKMNALTDLKVIAKLYEASRAGVKTDLIVRGICSLRPGLKDVSENIRVISIVGRFLEHSRVFYFQNAGQPELYLSSADLMGRNLDRRVELMFPIEEPALAAVIKREALDIALADRSRARMLHADASYSRVTADGDAALDSQQTIMLQRLARAQQRTPVPREVPPDDGKP
jgi:polyphosphate kinase